MKELGFSTKAIHSGQPPDPTTGAILVPIYQTTTYVQKEVGKDKGYTYSRGGNPTVKALESNIADLEGGLAGTAFASGMAAISAIMALFKAGDHIIVSEVVYGGTPRLCNSILTNYGMEFSYIDTSEASNVEKTIKRNTKMVFIETPGNPTMKISDIKEIAKVVGRVQDPPLLVVDNTFPTPYFQQPFKLGADLVMHSTTKYLDGHNATIGGIVISKTPEIDERLKFIQKSVGAVLSPFNAWLTIMGIKTLALRMERHNLNALGVAKFLKQHQKVCSVFYPGLPDHPQHAIVKKQMTGIGGMIAFELHGGVEAGKKLMKSVKVCSLAENLGSCETLITHPATMTHAEIPKEKREKIGITDGLVRISVGLEDVEDIINDLDNALKGGINYVR
ncbi:MAG: PLP-dependent transferase [Candidatus Stahlbacteria bacterium]|nr:PLP-dependent transferase [Candidatus Stahlbacteria bacterium]